MSGRYASISRRLPTARLARFGDRWLGRDARPARRAAATAASTGFDADRLRALTEAPRHYGFHGTLKPPFHLADGCDAAELRRALMAFAARQAPFQIDSLHLREIGDFLALIPGGAGDRARRAGRCLRDPFRRLSARRPMRRSWQSATQPGLTPRQAELLARWGYPYVLDEFRFHLTLTGAIADAAERKRCRDACCSRWSRRCLSQAVPVRELCLFHQPDRATPFRLIAALSFRPMKPQADIAIRAGPSGLCHRAVRARARTASSPMRATRLGVESAHVFARRHITRPADSGGEDHIRHHAGRRSSATAAPAASPCHWRGNGLGYGVECGDRPVAGMRAAMWC